MHLRYRPSSNSPSIFSYITVAHAVTQPAPTKQAKEVSKELQRFAFIGFYVKALAICAWHYKRTVVILHTLVRQMQLAQRKRHFVMVIRLRNLIRISEASRSLP